MIGKEVLAKRPVSIYEVEELLRGIEEPTYEQKATLDYVREIKKVDKETAEKVVEKLKELGLDEEVAIKIVNVMPKTAVELHAVLAKERSVGEELYEKILEAIREHI